MAESVRELLERRQRELRAALVSAKATVTSIEGELFEVNGALSGIENARQAFTAKMHGENPLTSSLSPETMILPSGNPLTGEYYPTVMDLNNNLSLKTEETTTIKQMVLKALDDVRFRPFGGTTAEIRDYIKTNFDRDVVITTLSPQLSRLREDGSVELNGGVWKLREPSLYGEKPPVPSNDLYEKKPK